MSRSLRMLGATALALVAWGSLAQAQSGCPQGCVSFDPGASTCGSAAAQDSVVTEFTQYLDRDYRSRYDIASGLIAIHVIEEARSSSHYGTSSVSVSDEFYLEGLPPGAPITFQARLDVSGFAEQTFQNQHSNCTAETEIGLREGATNEAKRGFLAAGPSTLIVTVTAAPGEPFTLTMFATSSISTYGRWTETGAEGHLVFGDLPKGTRVVSCGGYFTDTPVPTQRQSWGRLKSLYR